MFNDYNIPDKANRVLNFILICFLLISIRVWLLQGPQKALYEKEAMKPQRRTMILEASRATIRDRFGIPLATNQIQYNAAVRFADIRDIPSSVWVKEEGKKKRKCSPRKEHISKIALCLGEELDLDPKQVEDLIYAKAMLFPNTPFIIKEDISEKQYYRLKFQESSLRGILAQRSAKRVYPQGKVAADVVGYMGAISQNEYLAIAEELSTLQKYMAKRQESEAPLLPKGYSSPIEVKKRLIELEEKAYTVNDLVGKTGIEAKFDEELRGYYGKKTYEADVKGNFLRELPGARNPIPGHAIVLSLSSQLQEFAEKLLAEYENETAPELPWIKGGAIVAMLPQTGEILALASHPRHDPNDFIPSGDSEMKKNKNGRLLRWIENLALIREIWDGKRPFEKEIYSTEKKQFVDQQIFMDWDLYLSRVIGKESHVLEAMRKIKTLKQIFTLQESIARLLEISGQGRVSALIDVLYNEKGHITSRLPMALEEKREIMQHLVEGDEEVRSLKTLLDSYFSKIVYNDDKLLIYDLCHLVLHHDQVSPALKERFQGMTISEYRRRSQQWICCEEHLRKLMQQTFHRVDFEQWREEHFKLYLQEMRKEEKSQKKYAKPYTDYLEAMEKSLFEEFYAREKENYLQKLLFKEFLNDSEYDQEVKALHALLKVNEPHFHSLFHFAQEVGPEFAREFWRSVRAFNDLEAPLAGKYRGLRSEGIVQKEKHLAAAFYPLNGFGYGASLAYRHSTPAGSVFKIVTALSALQEKYVKSGKSDLNPLTLTDQMLPSSGGKKGMIMGYFANGEPIRKMYKGGSLLKGHPNIGQVDLKGALEQSSNLYFSVLAGDVLSSPEVLNETARSLGYGELSEIELSGETKGRLPDDLLYNRSGLYSYAIGQHTLVVTPLQTAVMLSTIANGGSLIKPKVVKEIRGEVREDSSLINPEKTFPFKEPLELVGIDFPLFTEALEKKAQSQIKLFSKEIKRSVYLPKEARKMILEGLYAVVNKERGTARLSVLKGDSVLKKAYAQMRSSIVGKTGTAEISYKQGLDAETKAELKNHIWFASILFKEPKNEEALANEEFLDPELIVVVYLKYGQSGKEGALLAMQVMQKYRELISKQTM